MGGGGGMGSAPRKQLSRSERRKIAQQQKRLGKPVTPGGKPATPGGMGSPPRKQLSRSERRKIANNRNVSQSRNVLEPLQPPEASPLLLEAPLELNVRLCLPSVAPSLSHRPKPLEANSPLELNVRLCMSTVAARGLCPPRHALVCSAARGPCPP
jgi:hypothetical protein